MICSEDLHKYQEQVTKKTSSEFIILKDPESYNKIIRKYFFKYNYLLRNVPVHSNVK